jgi:hypothetical protein
MQGANPSPGTGTMALLVALAPTAAFEGEQSSMVTRSDPFPRRTGVVAIMCGVVC